MGRLSMRKIHEILRQRYELKRSYRDIGRSLNISYSTVSTYILRAKEAGLSWPLPDISEEELHQKLFPSNDQSFSPKSLPDLEYVHRELRKKAMTLQLLWREYRDVHENGIGYTQFCLRYRTYAKQLSPVMRQVHKAGEKTFVDYAGMTVPWIDPSTGEIHEAQIFVGSLGASQMTYVEATATQKLADWISSHINMWHYFGGVSEIVVPDNLKSAVTKAHRYDPDINPNYQHFSEHYGVAIVPARAAMPKDKAKVENAVGCIERQILASLRHMTFTSIAEINDAIKTRLEAFNSQSFQKMKTSRRELFESIDKPALKPLPPERYHYASWSVARIHIDYHFEFDHHFYSVPYRYIHHKVDIRATGKMVECFYQGERIAAHIRCYQPYKFSTFKEHMPPAHAAYLEWTPERMNRWANKIGPHTKQFIERMLSSRPLPEQSYRACLGLLRLAERFTPERLERACAISYTAGATRYKEVESLLKNKLDSLPDIKAVNESRISLHENIRGSDYYK